jgi:4-amino-4-deoxy-L-arabinose transferase-like glycosyltransferase
MQSTADNNSLHKWLYFLIGLAVLVNFSGLFVPLMDPDAGVYASISKNMVLRNDYINLWFHDKDWLDKPHFQFWITAFFFKIFGLYDWVYKLPGILFALMGAYYSYLFAKKYYNKTVALWTAFILLTAMHFIISNNDVRAEPFLTGLIIASVFHFSNSLSKGFSMQLVAACFFAGCAVMTKGIYTLIPIGGAVACHLFITKNWREIFHWRWIVALVLVVLFISPELYSLWVQFDTHPEKIVFEKTNVSGIKFFLWDSQFGRFANTGPIKGKGDPSYFFHTLLWAFLPWCIIMYAALFSKIKSWIKKQVISTTEWFTISASLLSLLVFSVSKFQLPYYTNIIFPFLAILSAELITKQIESGKLAFKITQNFISIILIVLAAVIFFLYRPPVNFISIAVLVAFILLIVFIKRVIMNWNNAIPYIRSGLTALTVALFLNLLFYPDLLKYQSGNEAAFYINKNYPNTPVGRFEIYIPCAEFYLDEKMMITDIESVNKGVFAKPGLLFLNEEQLKQLEVSNVSFELIKEFPHFHITMLKLKFLNPATRESQLQKRYLIKLL